MFDSTIGKVVAVVAGATTLAAFIMFRMLLSANAEIGKANAEIEEAAGINDRQVLVLGEVKANNTRLISQLARAEEREKIALEGLLLSQAGLEEAKGNFQSRLAAARDGVTNEELVCAFEPIPGYYISSLREQGDSVRP